MRQFLIVLLQTSRGNPPKNNVVSIKPAIKYQLMRFLKGYYTIRHDINKVLQYLKNEELIKYL
jgi:hypothetical protein